MLISHKASNGKLSAALSAALKYRNDLRSAPPNMVRRQPVRGHAQHAASASIAPKAQLHVSRMAVNGKAIAGLCCLGCVGTV